MEQLEVLKGKVEQHDSDIKELKQQQIRTNDKLGNVQLQLTEIKASNDENNRFIREQNNAILSEVISYKNRKLDNKYKVITLVVTGLLGSSGLIYMLAELFTK